MRTPLKTDGAPAPAGTYSQGIVANGTLIFLSGQTPRLSDGSRLVGVSFERQAVQAMDNLEAVAEAAGCSLAEHFVKATVYLKNLEDRFVFDEVFARYVGATPPARAIVQSNFTDFDIEIEAILAK